MAGRNRGPGGTPENRRGTRRSQQQPRTVPTHQPGATRTRRHDSQPQAHAGLDHERGDCRGIRREPGRRNGVRLGPPPPGLLTGPVPGPGHHVVRAPARRHPRPGGRVRSENGLGDQREPARHTDGIRSLQRPSPDRRRTPGAEGPLSCRRAHLVGRTEPRSAEPGDPRLPATGRLARRRPCHRPGQGQPHLSRGGEAAPAPSVEGFGANRFAVDTSGHSDYWNNNSESLTNQARILVGAYDKTTLDKGGQAPPEMP